MPPIKITEAYGPSIIWYNRLINLSMRCSTWRGNDLTKLSRQAQLLGLSEIREKERAMERVRTVMSLGNYSKAIAVEWFLKVIIVSRKR